MPGALGCREGLRWKHWRVAVCGRVARWRRSSTPASDCAHTGAGGWLPRERAPGSSNGGRDMVRPWVDGDGTPAARWRSGECGLREIGGMGRTEGRPKLLALGQQTRRGLNGGRGTSPRPRRMAAELL
jgi:hypothetical protein